MKQKSKPFGERITIPKKPTCIIGIDPGSSSGAIAFHEFAEHGHILTCMNLPDDLASLRSSIADIVRRPEYSRSNVFAFLENPTGVPRNKRVGLGSSMKFARNVGELEGLLVGMYIKHHLVRPQEWQKRLGCLTGGDKSVSYAAAQRRYPDDSFSKRQADAVLIGHYGCLFVFGDV